MPSEVRKIAFSAEVLRTLDPHRKYVFALVSHIFNELMLLQKWAHISRRPPGSPGPQEDAAVGISWFLLRLLYAKVYEALQKEVLTKPSIESTLRSDYFDHVEGLNQQWDDVLSLYSQLEWLGWIRNKVGFHYMTESQWASGLDGSMCDGAYAYIGKRYADTYFHWAEMTAALPALQHVNPEKPFEGLQQMLDELNQLLGGITDCLARGLQAFLRQSGVGAEISEPIRFDAPPLSPVALHFFFSDDRSE